MNPVVIVHLIAAVLAIAAAVPLIRRKVKMNDWYGVRIPASFASEDAWFDINHYGGRLLLFWGLTIAGTATVGAFLEKKEWITYNWVALVVIVGGLAVVIAKIYGYARARKGANRPPGAIPPSSSGAD
ncbi:MAG TPA: SdpI family protein [Candidatus Didemnitutus sp.]|nr:SdpI family protein [Candidatus Didemnitutus sp.]